MSFALQFTESFQLALKTAPTMAAPDWSTAGNRTKILKRTGRDRSGSVLNVAFEDLGYHFMDGGNHERIFSYEWNQKDVVAVDGLGEVWARACWLGRYRYDIVGEVENNLAEFDMTIRGMFDVRARLSFGIFFAESNDPSVGPGLWHPDRSDTIPLSEWRSPDGGTEDLPWRFADGDELLVLIMSVARPELLRARSFTYGDLGWGPAVDLLD